MGLALFAFGELIVRWFVPLGVVGPSFTEHDPVYGERLKRSFSARRTTPESSYVVRTNSLGFRDPEPGGSLEGAILFLGDSYTMGYGVENDESFPALVRERLRESGHPDIPVVNAGLGGSGNGWWLPFLERRAPTFDPRAVVLQVADNDFGDNAAERMFALEPGGVLRARPIPPRDFGHRAQVILDAIPGLGYSHLVGLVRVAVENLGGSAASPAATASPAELEDRKLELTGALLAGAIERARARGWFVLGLLVGMEGERRHTVEAVFDAWAVPWVRVPSKPEAPELYYEIDDHWNRRGHEVAADRLWGTLEPGIEEGAGTPSLEPAAR